MQRHDQQAPLVICHFVLRRLNRDVGSAGLVLSKCRKSRTRWRGLGVGVAAGRSEGACETPGPLAVGSEVVDDGSGPCRKYKV